MRTKKAPFQKNMEFTLYRKYGKNPQPTEQEIKAMNEKGFYYLDTGKTSMIRMKGKTEEKAIYCGGGYWTISPLEYSSLENMYYRSYFLITV